ncbi:MAG TPA: M67 family metallopeptidase [Anaerolineae bacterium]|nr:M67 family metallopeptidase [Anaerolineae bacterium]
MSDERTPDRAPRVLSSSDEPAVAGDGEVVPGVDAWQRAADSGASAPGRGGRAPWVPASAALSPAIRDELIDWLRGALPNEGCGLLVSDRTPENGGVPSRFVGMRNAAASPYRYLMDSEELLRVMLEIDDADEVVWGIVHSHVASPPYPSPTDVGLAAYPDAVYLLVSFAAEPPEVRAWTIVAGSVNEVVLERT